MNKQTQQLELTLKQDVINGFSYSFTNSLLEKLKKLKEEDRIFKDGWEKATEVETRNHCTSSITKIASVVINYLDDQIRAGCGSDMKPTTIDNLITTGEEFLSIFSSEKK